MRATWLIALTLLVVLWVPALILPVDGWVFVIPILLTLAVLSGLLLYERRTSAGSSEARKRALAIAISERLRAAGPDQQLRINTMREDIRDAVAKLTGSAPGAAARHAIDALPWYLVIGPPQSGKSSMLASSGLTFGYVTPAGGAQGGRGVRFWLTQHAAYLDTTGDYMTGEATYAEWLALLRELDVTRPGQTLQGVVVTLAADAVMQTRPDDLDALGKRVRERLDEVMGYLGIEVPVYLVVTRCDALPGFMEFFSDQRGADRHQVFGFTMPARTRDNPPAKVMQLFDALAYDLERRMYRRVLPRAHVEVRGSVYMFSQWFAGLRSGLMAFATRIFAQNMYLDQICARGVYFSSAADATEVLGLDPSVRPSSSGERGYFLRDLFANIMLPDREFARMSASELQRRLHRRLAIATPMLGVALLLPVLAWHAYSENVEMLSQFRTAMNECVSMVPPVSIEKLDVLRARVDRIRLHELNGPPLHMRFGMYVGDEVQRRTATVYASLIYREVSQRAVERTYRDLLNFSSRYGATNAVPTSDERIAYSDTLRMYLMLTTPRAPDDPPLSEMNQRTWFNNRLAEVWNNANPTQSTLVVNARLSIIELYALVLAADQRLGYPRDLQLVTRVKTILARG